ncbi:MAG: hypothetical protein SFT81_06935 [Candidatus Caenarcaniphilales bacterium]|nr:hypothetical protein [Candidatus Caenarcaniphilales bacterium]
MISIYIGKVYQAFSMTTPARDNLSDDPFGRKLISDLQAQRNASTPQFLNLQELKDALTKAGSSGGAEIIDAFLATRDDGSLEVLGNDSGTGGDQFDNSITGELEQFGKFIANWSNDGNVDDTGLINTELSSQIDKEQDEAQILAGLGGSPNNRDLDPNKWSISFEALETVFVSNTEQAESSPNTKPSDNASPDPNSPLSLPNSSKIQGEFDFSEKPNAVFSVSNYDRVFSSEILEIFEGIKGLNLGTPNLTQGAFLNRTIPLLVHTLDDWRTRNKSKDKQTLQQLFNSNDPITRLQTALALSLGDGLDPNKLSKKIRNEDKAAFEYLTELYSSIDNQKDLTGETISSLVQTSYELHKTYNQNKKDDKIQAGKEAWLKTYIRGGNLAGRDLDQAKAFAIKWLTEQFMGTSTTDKDQAVQKFAGSIQSIGLYNQNTKEFNVKLADGETKTLKVRVPSWDKDTDGQISYEILKEIFNTQATDTRDWLDGLMTA